MESTNCTIPSKLPQIPCHIKIDPQDYPELSKHKWRVQPSNSWIDHSPTWSVLRTVQGKNLFMRAVILGKKPGFNIRHLNGDGLDCRRSNLVHIPDRHTREVLECALKYPGGITLEDALEFTKTFHQTDAQKAEVIWSHIEWLFDFDFDTSKYTPKPTD